MSISHTNLFRRPNGIWYIIYQEDGKVHWKTTGKTLKHEALNALKDFCTQPVSRTPVLLFSEFEKEFKVLQASSLRESTINRIYLPAFNTFKSCCGDRPLSSYSIRDVETFKSQRLSTCRATTVNIEFRTLRAAFNLAVKWQFLEENPFTRSSQVKVPERLPVYFSKEDFRKLIAQVREPFLKELFLFAALTGLRLGEILNLNWQNVDLERRLIVVANSEEFSTKSGRCRFVPMNNAVFETLALREATKAVCAAVFHSEGTRLQHSYVQHKFKKYIRRAELNDALRFHSLRHTFATWLVQGGVNIYEVQKLLGHSDIRTTEIYSHLASSELHDAVNKITALLN